MDTAHKRLQNAATQRPHLADTVEKVTDLIRTWSDLKSTCDGGLFGDGLSQFHLTSSKVQEFHSTNFAVNLLEQVERAFFNSIGAKLPM